MIQLILGGARSGKSSYAEKIITAQPGPWHYLATAQARDDEMSDRIAEHQKQRGDGWQLIEETTDLIAALSKIPGDQPVLVDCLTLWLSNLMEQEKNVSDEISELCYFLTDNTNRNICFVSNEVGMGLVPMSPLGRNFRDEAGRMNQAIANLANEVVFVIAGQPLVIKGAKS